MHLEVIAAAGDTTLIGEDLSSALCAGGGGGRRWTGGPAAGAQNAQRNPENQQQYPIWQGRDGNLSLKSPKETGIYKTPGL